MPPRATMHLGYPRPPRHLPTRCVYQIGLRRFSVGLGAPRDAQCISGTPAPFTATRCVYQIGLRRFSVGLGAPRAAQCISGAPTPFTATRYEDYANRRSKFMGPLRGCPRAICRRDMRIANQVQIYGSIAGVPPRHLPTRHGDYESGPNLWVHCGGAPAPFANETWGLRIRAKFMGPLRGYFSTCPTKVDPK